MVKNRTRNVTLLLNELAKGRQEARDELISLIYDDLRDVAHRQLFRERPNEALQTTALVHEAYLRLFRVESTSWKNRSHFFGAAAQAMRRIMIDRARKHKCLKRGAGKSSISFDEASILHADTHCDEILALDEALERLEEIDERKSQVVILRYFAGLDMNAISDLLSISPITARRDWAYAKAWLYRELNKGELNDEPLERNA